MSEVAALYCEERLKKYTLSHTPMRHAIRGLSLVILELDSSHKREYKKI